MLKSPIRTSYVHRFLRESSRRLGNLKTVRILAALNISTLAFAAWTLWIYVSYGRTQQRLSNEQLALAVRQTEASAQFELARAKLSAEGLGLENQLKRLAISEATQRKIRISHDLDVELSGQTYEGDFQLAIENTSTTQVEVSWVVFEWYLGELKGELENNAALQINAPPKHERGIAESGPVQWVFQGSHGFLFKGSHLLDYRSFANKPYFELGGGPSKSLAPGDKSEYTMPLLVRAAPDRWLGVAAIVGIDGGKSGSNVYWVSKWFPLRSAEHERSNEEQK